MHHCKKLLTMLGGAWVFLWLLGVGFAQQQPRAIAGIAGNYFVCGVRLLHRKTMCDQRLQIDLAVRQKSKEAFHVARFCPATWPMG